MVKAKNPKALIASASSGTHRAAGSEAMRRPNTVKTQPARSPDAESRWRRRMLGETVKIVDTADKRRAAKQAAADAGRATTEQLKERAELLRQLGDFLNHGLDRVADKSARTSKPIADEGARSAGEPQRLNAGTGRR